MSKRYQIMMSAVVLSVGLLQAGTTLAGSLYPTNAPGPTMHTLEEIYQKQVDSERKVDFLGSPQTMSATTAVINAGYYAATNLTRVDADLAAGNIAANVTILGVTGTVGGSYLAAVPQTGQTPTVPLNPAPAGSDGALQKGVALPSPRFTNNGDGTVNDNLTGLIWLRNANAFGVRNWASALTNCAALNSGECGLTDGSVEGDWRLPNIKELKSIIGWDTSNPALPLGHPFTNVQYALGMDFYWTSSTVVNMSNYAWRVELREGTIMYGDKTVAGDISGNYYVWPVRSGQ